MCVCVCDYVGVCIGVVLARASIDSLDTRDGVSVDGK